MGRDVSILVLSVFLSFPWSCCFASVDPGEDFVGYMEGLKAAEEERIRYEQMLSAHEEWRQTTWGGWAVRQLQAIGNHFAPFFDTIADVVSSGKTGPSQVLLLLLVRSLLIAAVIIAFLAFTRLLSSITGKEIIVEQEIIIEEDEDDDRQNEGPKNGKDALAQPKQRRNARDKKTQ